MSFELKTRGNTRKTVVKLYETVGENQVETIFEPEHLRITQEVGERLVEIAEGVDEEQQAYWENKNKPKKDQKKLKRPRNPIIEQLIYLIKDTDIVNGGEKLPPTRETFEMMEASILASILNAITGTVLPEKKTS